MAYYLGRLVIDDDIEAKIRGKHNITSDQVKEALQYPAEAEAAPDDDPVYGWRLIAVGTTAEGRTVIAYLKPVPQWEDEPDTWDIRTARFVDH